MYRDVEEFRNVLPSVMIKKREEELVPVAFPGSWRTCLNWLTLPSEKSSFRDAEVRLTALNMTNIMELSEKGEANDFIVECVGGITTYCFKR